VRRLLSPPRPILPPASDGSAARRKYGEKDH